MRKYLRILERVRRARPDIALSGDFIVGFPGETESDFAATLALVRDVNYASAFSFKYSPRPGTPAAEHDDQVTDDVKIGTPRPVAGLARNATAGLQPGLYRPRFDRCSSTGRGAIRDSSGGRSPYLQAVHAEARGYGVGDIVDAGSKQLAPTAFQPIFNPRPMILARRCGRQQKEQ